MKKLLTETELDQLRDWLSFHTEITGGWKDIISQWKSSRGLGRYR